MRKGKILIEIPDMGLPLPRKAHVSPDSIWIFHGRSWRANLLSVFVLATTGVLPVGVVFAADAVEGQCRRLCGAVMDMHANRCADTQCLKQAETAYASCLSGCVTKSGGEPESKSAELRKGT
jgi:hypothetical protein